MVFIIIKTKSHYTLIFFRIGNDNDNTQKLVCMVNMVLNFVLIIVMIGRSVWCMLGKFGGKYTLVLTHSSKRMCYGPLNTFSSKVKFLISLGCTLSSKIKNNDNCPLFLFSSILWLYTQFSQNYVFHNTCESLSRFGHCSQSSNFKNLGVMF